MMATQNRTFVPVELEPNQFRKFMIILRITFCDELVSTARPKLKKSILVFLICFKNASSYAPKIESDTMEKKFESSSETKKRGRYWYLDW